MSVGQLSLGTRDSLGINTLGVFVGLLGPAGTVSTMATSGGQTFQITGTSVGGKVLTAKLPLPANSKIVAVNVPTTQGGKDDIIIIIITTNYLFFYTNNLNGGSVIMD